MTDSMVIETVLTGTVKKFDSDRKFGFIQLESGPDLFFHLNNGATASEVNGEVVFSGKPTGTPTEGSLLIFKIGEGKRGSAAIPWALASDLDQVSTTAKPVVISKPPTANRQKIEVGIVFESKDDKHRHAVAHKDDTEFSWRPGLPATSLLSQYPMLKGYKALTKVLGQKMAQLRHDIRSYADFLQNPPMVELDKNGNGTLSVLGFTLQVEAGHLTRDHDDTIGGVSIAEICQHAALMTMIQINVINPRLGLQQPWVDGGTGLDAIWWHVERILRNSLNTLAQVLYSYSYLTDPEVKVKLAAIGDDVRAGVHDSGLMWTAMGQQPVCFTGTNVPDTRLTFLDFPFRQNQNWQKRNSTEPVELSVYITLSDQPVPAEVQEQPAWESYLITYRYQIAEVIGFDEWPHMAAAFGLS